MSSMNSSAQALIATARETLTRNDTVAAIRAALKERSGKSWSVTGGRATAYGWINICSPRSRCGEYGSMTEAERAELSKLLGGVRVHQQGENIAAGHDFYREYLARAAGETPAKIAEAYWD